MKKSIYSLISIIIIFFIGVYILTGYGDGIHVQKERSSDVVNVIVDNNLAKNDDTKENIIAADSVKQIEPIIWYADITHDGIDEKIVVDLTYVINDPRTGEEQTVSVYSGSTGDLIWTGHADTVHVGWNGIYIYNDGNNEYLLIWKPTIYQGRADFLFDVFSLTEGGEIQELTKETLQFDMNHPNEYDINTISSYVDKVNSYLENSYVLVDTDNSTPVYSTENNKIKNPYDASVILYELDK